MARADRAVPGRAPAAHGDVLRPGRLDRALGPARSRGPARGDRRLPPLRRRRRSTASTASSPSTWATACWPISATRRRTRTTPSGRSGPGSRSSRRCGDLAAPAGDRAARPGRHRHRAGRRRRSDRQRRGAGAGGRRRDPEPRRPAARPGRAGQRRHRRRHAPAGRRPVRVRRSRRRRGQGLRRAGPGLAGARRQRGGEPVRGVARRGPDAAGRARGGDRLLLRRWEQAKGGEGRVVLLSGEPGIGKSRLLAALQERLARRAAYPPALLLLAAPPGQRAVPVHRAARARGRVRARRSAGGAGSASWRRCWRRPRRPRRTWRCWPSCCRSRPATATPRRRSPRSARGSGPSRRCCASSSGCRHARARC